MLARRGIGLGLLRAAELSALVTARGAMTASERAA
jgi:hypothetical protein